MAYAVFLDPKFLEKEEDKDGNIKTKDGFLPDL